MKKLILLATSLATFAAAFAQPSKEEILDKLVDNTTNTRQKLENRQYIGGHKLDTNFVFQNTLYKVFRSTLNVDSLIASQPQLSLISVNEFITYPIYRQPAIKFLKAPEFIKYNTINYIFTYDVSKNSEGYYSENIIIYDAVTDRKLRSLIIHYEPYSNQIRTIIDNCYEHLK